MGKREKFITIALAVLILGIILGVQATGLAEEQEQPADAEEYGQLVLSARYGMKKRYINIWQNEEGDYYFFLPANVSLEQVKFANLGGNALWLDNALYQGRETSLREIDCGREYAMRMNTANGILKEERLFFVQSENLPSVFIDTESGNLDSIVADKNNREAAAVYIYDKDGQQAYGGDSEYIKCRGNSTFYEMDKKSFQFSLYKKKALLGMPKAKKWILLANAKDGTLLRNKLIYDFAENYSDVGGMDGQHVDLYLNGEYAGNYYLCEKIEVDGNKVAIQDLEKLNEAVNSDDAIENGEQFISEDGTYKAVEGLASPSDITGGYLVVLATEDDYDACRSGFITSMGYRYKIISPEDASQEEVAYIQRIFNEFEAALGQEDGINPDTGKHISEYVDLESWAQKFLIEECFQNADAAGASVYFYKDSDSADAKIKSGPAWDYDRAIGAYLSGRYSSLDDPEQLSYYYIYSKEMMQHKEVKETVCRLFKDWFMPYIKQEFASEVAYWGEYLQGSAYMNEIRWPKGGDYYVSYAVNCQYLVEFMNARIAFLEDVFLKGKEYHTVTFLTVDGSPNFVYTIQDGGHMTKEAPTVVSYVGIFAGWKNTKTGVMYDQRLPVLEDTVYEAQWIPADLIVQNGLAVSEMDVQDVDVDGLQAIVDAIREMQEAESGD